MANTTIQLKKSGIAANVPISLANGELAINYADGKLFYKNTTGHIVAFSSASNTNSFGTVNANGTFVISTTPGDILTLIPGNNIQIVGNATSESITISASGGSMDYAYANAIGAAANAWTNTVFGYSNTYAQTVSAASNGWANTVGTAANGWANGVGTAANSYAVTVGAASNGWANTVAAGANAWSNTKVSSVTGTAAQIYSSGGTTPTINLITTAVTAATYGNSSIIPVITVDAYGRLTSVSNVATSGGGGGGYYNGNRGEISASNYGDIFRVHSNTLSTNVTIYSGNNAICAGPLTIATGQTLTIQTGARSAIV